MFVYHYRRFFMPESESYESLSALFQRAWADMEYENAYPDRVMMDDALLIAQNELVDLVWYQAPQYASDPAFDAYFDRAAAALMPH